MFKHNLKFANFYVSQKMKYEITDMPYISIEWKDILYKNNNFLFGLTTA